MATNPFKYNTPRFFKSNDPYYWELDNVPINQLWENDQYLREEINSLSLVGTVTRRGFAELKPVATGTDNIISVLPGRFTGRVNDALTKPAFQRFIYANNKSDGSFTTHTNVDITQTQFDAMVSGIHSNLAANSTGMNGLIDSFALYPSLDVANKVGVASTGTHLDGYGADTPFPLLSLAGISWDHAPSETGSSLANKLDWLHRQFISMYGGVTRMAIVDVPTTLTIEVPAFNDSDFTYVDNNGVTQQVANSTTRIDMLFCYTVPVDVSATTIIPDQATGPVTLTSPVLGILKGAGAYVQKISNGKFVIKNKVSPEGHTQIVATVGDQFVNDIGFSGVAGSFPAPDDILNIAPNLQLSLETDSLTLVGQSILPLAYIIVNKNEATNVLGKPILTEENIIDIRPLLRTTELTFAERAGLAAATPPLSFANPAVGRHQLETVASNLRSQIGQVVGGQLIPGFPRSVGGGKIYGGFNYGPEGAIIAPGAGSTGLGVIILDFSVIPDLPDWDIADWFTFYQVDPATNGAWVSPGLLRNDCINTRSYRRGGGENDLNFITNRLDYGPTGDSTGFLNFTGRLGTENYKGLTNGYSIHFVKKVILLDRSDVAWMTDYDVIAQLENCIPQSTRGSYDKDINEAGSAGIWIEKQFDRFTVYVAWVANSPNWEGASEKTQTHGAGQEPRENRTVYGYTGFAVHTESMGLNNANNSKIDSGSKDSIQPFFGACTYPTVSFNIVGYPSNTYNKVLGGTGAQISLK